MLPRHGLGRRKDTETPDNLSLYKLVTRSPNLAFVTHVDLSSGFPEVYDQGQLGSCTSNAILGAYAFEMKKQKEPVVQLSRLYHYYQERVKEGTVSADAGATIEDSVWVLQQGPGVCSESVWPYKIQKFAMKPPTAADADAKNHHVTASQRLVGNLSELKQVLLNGDPITFGIDVYTSFESPQAEATGVIPMPMEGEQILGGHAIVLVGYDDDKQQFKFRNSWGPTWGDKGYGYIPYAYVTNPDLSSDFWVITAVKDAPQPTPPNPVPPVPPTPPNPVPPVPPTPPPNPFPPSNGTYASSIILPAGLTITFQ